MKLTQQQRAWLSLAVLVTVIVIGIFTTSTDAPPSTPPASATTTSTASALTASWYQVFFTAPLYPDNDPKKHTASLDAKLTEFIASATASVDIAIYQLDLPNVTQALLDARKRGATVRAVTGIDILNDAGENPSFKELQKAGIKVVGGNPNAIMHNKFVVADGARVWTGSWNFTTNDTWRYNNNGIAITSADLANNYTATFEKMWKDGLFGRQRKPGGVRHVLQIGGATVENYFAPEDKVAEKIIARLKQAQRSVDFMAFSFTDDDIGSILLQRAKSAVKIRGVFETTGSETKFSEYGKLKDAKLEVYQDGNPYLMHHKVFIIDGKTVILGSFNFSQNAEEENDENLLIIDDEPLATAFTAEFSRVLDAAKSAK
ncbi:MAG: phospholipase [Chloroflexi bacterium]|nr:phospholipase [Chloroflexota bacterium]